MNRILFEPGECADGRLTLRDARADHLRHVLRAEPGDAVRLGEINGRLAEGRVERVTADAVDLTLIWGEIPPRPEVDLILALPRPKVLKRILPQIAALGVGRLFLVNAARVERVYFDTHVLEPGCIRTALTEGLTQAGDTRLPEVRVERRLKPFVEDDLDAATDAATRWLLHPGADRPILDAPLPPGRLLLAIGPEGGWVPYERDLFAARGFGPVHLHDRILRSDTATVAALATAHARRSAEKGHSLYHSVH